MVMMIATPTRSQVARAALELITERDPQVVEAQIKRLFTERMRVLGPARALCPKYARSLAPGRFYDFEEASVEITGMSEASNRVFAYVEFEGVRRPPVTTTGDEPAGQRMRAQGLVLLQFSGLQVDEAWSVLRWD